MSRVSSELIDVYLQKNSAPVKPLSAQEELRLEQLEGVVVRNFQTFVEVGRALAEIQERKLYRTKAVTFKKYCKELFDISESRSYELIGAAGVIENLRNCGGFKDDQQNLHSCGGFDEDTQRLPLNEAQARPLAGLKPEQQITVWKAALASAPKGKVTSNHVRKVVKSFVGEKIKESVQRTQRDVVVSCSAEFSEAFKVFSDQIVKERNSNYKHTGRGWILNALDQLRAEIAEDGDAIEDRVIKGGSNDWNKLQRAGYSLFRMDQSNNTIKTRSLDTGGWLKHSGPFGTIKEMEAEYRVILQDDMHLQG